MLLAVGGCGGSRGPAATTGPDPDPGPDLAGANGIQREMRLLTYALEQSVIAIADGDVSGLPRLLHRAHSAKSETEAEIASGQYRPPSNPEGLLRFKELDEAFHADLITMVRAARANDLDATAAAMGVVMRGCVPCHAEFR